MKKTNDRRNFLKLFLSGGLVAATTGVAAAGSPDKNEDGDTVKMLTEDGKLVELDKATLEKFRTGKKATDQEIHDFIEPTSHPGEAPSAKT